MKILTFSRKIFDFEVDVASLEPEARSIVNVRDNNPLGMLYPAIKGRMIHDINKDYKNRRK